MKLKLQKKQLQPNSLSPVLFNVIIDTITDQIKKDLIYTYKLEKTTSKYYCMKSLRLIIWKYPKLKFIIIAIKPIRLKAEIERMSCNLLT